MSAAGAPAPRLASLARRLGSLVYEGLLLTAMVFVAGFLAAPFVTPGHAASASELAIPGLPQRVALFCLLFAALAWFYVRSWSQGRRTLPMKTWRLRMVTPDGRPLARRTALLRYLAAWLGPTLALVTYAVLRPYGLGAHATWLFALGYLWAVLDPERQFLHDRLAGTRIAAD